MDDKYRSALYVFLIGLGIVLAISLIVWMIGKVIRYVILVGLVFIIVSAYLYYKRLVKQENK